MEKQWSCAARAMAPCALFQPKVCLSAACLPPSLRRRRHYCARAPMPRALLTPLIYQPTLSIHPINHVNHTLSATSCQPHSVNHILSTTPCQPHPVNPTPSIPPHQPHPVNPTASIASTRAPGPGLGLVGSRGHGRVLSVRGDGSKRDIPMEVVQSPERRPLLDVGGQVARLVA